MKISNLNCFVTAPEETELETSEYSALINLWMMMEV